MLGATGRRRAQRGDGRTDGRRGGDGHCRHRSQRRGAGRTSGRDWGAAKAAGVVGANGGLGQSVPPPKLGHRARLTAQRQSLGNGWQIRRTYPFRPAYPIF